MQSHNTEPSVFAGPITLPNTELLDRPTVELAQTERPPLREAAPFEEVDPLSIAPDPGELAPLYIDAREKYEDGMSLALATPKRSLKVITARYVVERSTQEDFNAVDFWDDNFTTPQPNNGLFVAAPGTNLETHIRNIRPLFIHKKEDVGPSDIMLPYNRSVAGAGRFSEHEFAWDGYHMGKGHAADNRLDLVLNTVDNAEFEINQFGYPVNGSASFFVTRPQIPYFSNEISMLADEYGNDALRHYLPAMEKEYKGYWLDGEKYLEDKPDDGRIYTHRTLVRVPMGEGKFAYLNRYWDDADGPRLESYKEDVELGERVVSGLSGQERERRLQKFYKDIRGAAASAHDFGSRWFADGRTMETINTTDILPMDLNSQLARTEQMLARAHRADGNEDKAREYEQRFYQRVAAVNKYHWDPKDRIYRDYDMVKGRQTNIVSAAMAYPLYTGISSADQSFGVASAIKRDLLFPGGVVATTTDGTNQQWDGGTKNGDGPKNVWAPLNWAAARGLARMAHLMKDARVGVDVEPLITLSEQVRANYMSGVRAVFNATGTVPEKIRGDDPSQLGSGGEYKTVRSLAMTGEIWIAFSKWDPTDPKGCLPIGSLAVSYNS